jgi:GT2 family glycosyltransferase
MKPLYSIIVLFYHRSPELVEMAKDCIASIKNNSKDYELIVVDQGSPEDESWLTCDTYIRFSENRGISHGWNAGLKAARGKYFVVCNDDIIVHGDWLTELRKAMDMPQAGMANVHVQHLPHGIGIVETIKWLSGSCFMLTPKTIEKVGYFYEGYDKCNFEDTDYWTRILQAGLKCYKNNAITVQHKEGQTVHAPDLAARFEKNKQIYIDRFGFDPQPVFYGPDPLPKSLLDTLSP